YLDAAKRLAAFLMSDLAAQGGGFLASTPDPNAVGVLAERRVPFEDNVMAVRFLARLAHIADDASAQPYRVAIAGTLAAIGTREAIGERGRMVGDLLLAIEETRDLVRMPAQGRSTAMAMSEPRE
ncbi:MAG: hypothetical protein ACREJ3_15725, partial [Polyangiaceae bacterium]